MKTCQCEICGMAIKAPVCAKCDTTLEEKTIEKDGKKIQVSECPQGHGKMKSPTCCGHDMKCSS